LLCSTISSISKCLLFYKTIANVPLDSSAEAFFLFRQTILSKPPASGHQAEAEKVDGATAAIVIVDEEQSGDVSPQVRDGHCGVGVFGITAILWQKKNPLKPLSKCWLSGKVVKNDKIIEIERTRVRSPPRATSLKKC
jgi:hypothetical protein